MDNLDSHRIAFLERKVDYLIKYLGIDPAHIVNGIMPIGAPGWRPAEDDLPPGMPGLEVAPTSEISDISLAPVYDALQRQRPIDAIKIYRSLTGASLADAKRAVDSMARDL
jgi:ribosomal protein L7/L12